MRNVLFLDIDGVLHRGIARRSGRGVMSSSPGHIELFEYAPVLEDLLCPYPSVEIIVSSDWALVMGLEFTRNSMPSAQLRERIKGATFDGCGFDSRLWPMMSRGGQVLDYVKRNTPLRWLAVDDRSDGFEAFSRQLIHCQTDVGLGDPSVVDLFRRRLAQHFAN